MFFFSSFKYNIVNIKILTFFWPTSTVFLINKLFFKFINAKQKFWGVPHFLHICVISLCLSRFGSAIKVIMLCPRLSTLWTMLYWGLPSLGKRKIQQRMVRYRLQISLVISSKFKRINELLSPVKSSTS